MTSVMEIDKQIDQLKEQLAGVEGRKAEVYARIVGYYRSVVNWNKGKRDEYGQRINYADFESDTIKKPLTPAVEIKNETEKTEAIEIDFEEKKLEINPEAAAYSFFFKKRCPNCPPVKEVIESISLEGNKIDVDESEGLTEAMNLSVYSAPTVILYDAGGSEIYRTGNADKLKSFLKVKSA